MPNNTPYRILLPLRTVSDRLSASCVFPCDGVPRSSWDSVGERICFATQSTGRVTDKYRGLDKEQKDVLAQANEDFETLSSVRLADSRWIG